MHSKPYTYPIILLSAKLENSCCGSNFFLTSINFSKANPYNDCTSLLFKKFFLPQCGLLLYLHIAFSKSCNNGSYDSANNEGVLMLIYTILLVPAGLKYPAESCVTNLQVIPPNSYFPS